MTIPNAQLKQIKTLVTDAMKDCWQYESDPDRVWRADWTIAEIGKLVGAPSYEEVVTKLAKKEASA